MTSASNCSDILGVVVMWFRVALHKLLVSQPKPFVFMSLTESPDTFNEKGELDL